MRKLIFSIGALTLLIVLSSCSSVPTFSGEVPEDPTGVSEPTTWGEDVEMNVSIDKNFGLIPLSMRDYVNLKISFRGYTPPDDTSAENFMVFEDGKAQGFVIKKYTEYSNKTDIVFVVDVTGSMSNAIEGVRNSIVNFIDYLQESGLDVKVAVVPFDDKAPSGDYTYTPEWLNLADLDTAKSYVESLIAAGGNDTPENAYGAIMFAWNNVSWRSGSQRILILLTDAPSHYTGDGSTGFSPSYTKSEVISALSGKATLYMVATIGYYHEADSDFSAPNDPREIAQETGGFVIYQNPYEDVDLTSIGIAEAIVSTYIITFESDSPSGSHTVSVYYEGNDGEEGWVESTMEY